MSDQPTAAEIISAVEASGYLLEQQVADVFEALGYHVETNYAFPDPHEDVSRELDVRALKREFYNPARHESVFVEYLVECKNSSQPLVFFTRPKTAIDQNSAPTELVFTVGPKQKPLPENPKTFVEVPAFRHLGLVDKHWFWSRPEKSTQFCRIERSGKGWKADHGAVYNGHLVPLAKALAARQKAIGPGTVHFGYAWLWVLVVATTAPLYVVESSSAPPVCTAADHVTLMRTFSGATLKGLFSYEFVRVPALRRFVEESVKPFVRVVTSMAETQSANLFWQRPPGER